MNLRGVVATRPGSGTGAAAILHRVTAKVPTAEEYAAFDGRHCRNLWAQSGEDWRCPACARSKFELLRWTVCTRKIYDNGSVRIEKRMDWAGGLHRHHDHGIGDAYDDGDLLLDRRFDAEVICEQCNSADATAKRKLGLPANWSFSPQEIGRFVTATPHGKHRFDYAVAASIYEQATGLLAPG